MSEQNTDEQEKKETKGGAAPWMQGSANVGSGSLGGGGLAGASGGGLGGMGGGGGLAAKVLASKKLIFTVLVGGGISTGGLIGMQDFEPPKDPGEKVFLTREAPSGSATGPVIEGTNDGTYNALELARQANTGSYGDVEGEVGEPVAEGEDSASAEGVETTEEAADAPAGIPGMDPDMMAQMAEGMAGEEDSKAKKGLGQKFGKLSSNIGGSSSRLAGGSGLSGGIGGAFNKKQLSNRKLQQMSSMKGSRKASRSKTAVRNKGKGAKKGAFNRLNSMNKAMGSARTGTATDAAASHSQQWDSAKPTGEGISGAGASGIGAGGGEFSENEGGAAGGPLDAGTNNSTIGDQYQGPDTGGGTNVTPYQGTMDMMIALMMVIQVLMIIIGIAAILKNTVLGTAIAGTMWQAAFGIIAALSAVVLAGSLMIKSKYGQSGQADLMALSASTSMILGAIGFFREEFSAGFGWVMLLGSIAGLGASISAMNKKDKVDTDKVKSPNTASLLMNATETPAGRLARLLGPPDGRTA
jgi:hypothetical protein